MLKGFADGLKEVLESMNKRLSSLEESCANIADTLAELQDNEVERDVAVKNRLGELERSTREVQRGVQLLRDKQELADAQAELMKLSTVCARMQNCLRFALQQ